jgi:hypothetical protein
MAGNAFTPHFQGRVVITRAEVQPTASIVSLSSIDVIRMAC